MEKKSLIQRCRLLAGVCGLLFSGVQTGAAADTDTNAILNVWLAEQAKIQSWSAEFIQTRQLKTLTQPLVAKGRLWFCAPSLFRWELGVPARTVALRATNELVILYPGLRRAEKYLLDGDATGPARDALAIFEAGFPRSRGELDQKLRLMSMSVTNDLWAASFEPVSADCRKFLPRVSVFFKTNDLSLAATELQFSEGSRVLTRFTNALVNPVIDKERFNAGIPAGFTVTTPMSK
jgi:outer membrane lipoprotein-sorting protein